MEKYTNIKANQQMLSCIGMSNDTIQECPNSDESIESYIVVVHNP